jgi:hypothetical protein
MTVSSDELGQISYGRSQSMTIRKRRPGAILMAAILLAAALPTAVAAASSTRVNSTPSSLPTWAHGSVIGAGPHNGVRLMLVAWPKGNFHVGQQVHLKVIGKTISSPSRPTFA